MGVMSSSVTLFGVRLAILQIFGTAVQDVFAGMGPDVTNGPAFNYGYAGQSFA